MLHALQRLRRTFSLIPPGLAWATCAACAGSSAEALPTTSGITSTPSSPEPVFQAEAAGPLTKATPLQIVSVFSYEPGEQLVGPATEIASFLSDARMNQDFGTEALRAMFVTPTPSTIKARKLLAIAWGPRSEFTIPRVKEVGRAAMRETLATGVDDMAYAPLSRDQGVTSIPVDDVAAAFVEGALSEFLAERNDTPSKEFMLRHVTYEAGPTFLAAVSVAMTRGADAARFGSEGGEPGR